MGAGSAVSAGARGTSGFAEAEGPPRRVGGGAVPGAAVRPRSAYLRHRAGIGTCARLGTPPRTPAAAAWARAEPPVCQSQPPRVPCLETRRNRINSGMYMKSVLANGTKTEV